MKNAFVRGILFGHTAPLPFVGPHYWGYMPSEFATQCWVEICDDMDTWAIKEKLMWVRSGDREARDRRWTRRQQYRSALLAEVERLRKEIDQMEEPPLRGRA